MFMQSRIKSYYKREIAWENVRFHLWDFSERDLL